MQLAAFFPCFSPYAAFAIYLETEINLLYYETYLFRNLYPTYHGVSRLFGDNIHTVLEAKHV